MCTYVLMSVIVHVCVCTCVHVSECEYVKAGEARTSLGGGVEWPAAARSGMAVRLLGEFHAHDRWVTGKVISGK